jgi:hypothetical protein
MLVYLCEGELTATLCFGQSRDLKFRLGLLAIALVENLDVENALQNILKAQDANHLHVVFVLQGHWKIWGDGGIHILAQLKGVVEDFLRHFFQEFRALLGSTHYSQVRLTTRESPYNSAEYRFLV